MKKQSKGITLIALVITIIILLILAGISISQLTGSGLFEKAKEAKNRTEEAQELENQILSEYENQMESLGGNYGGTGGGQKPVTPADPTLPTNPATDITEAQSDYMLTKTVNSAIEDANGNKITIPAGFKIKVDSTTNNATTVDKGIVIVDSEGNEFVWIPVGTIYTNVEKTKTKTIELNRYTFGSNGVATAQNDATISGGYQELATSTYGNTTAKDIEEFKTSVTTNGGYYIGRYEARTVTARSAKTDPITTITEKGTDSVYNYVTQIQAAELSRNMYDDTKPFTSDLMNSYAWDTATLFLQKCGTNSKYSLKTSVNTSLATTGTNDTTKYTGTQDVQCNVYDMASNMREWTTETSIGSVAPYIACGGVCDDSEDCTSHRNTGSTLFSGYGVGFRPLLYL